MTTRPTHLRLVDDQTPTPTVKDITGADILCDCICGLWAHRDICLDQATLTVQYGDNSAYNTCVPCYQDTTAKEAELL